MKKLILIFLLSIFAFADISSSFKDSLEECDDLYKNGSASKSVKKLKALIKKAKNNDEKKYTYKLLSNILLSQKKLKDAAFYLSKALEMEKEKSSIAYNLSNIYMQDKEYKKCVKTLKQVRNLNPLVSRNLILCYYYDKDYKNAIFQGKRYIHQNKDDTEILQVLFNSSLQSKDYKSASFYFNKLDMKKDENYFVQLAFLNEKAGKIEEALSILGYIYKKAMIKNQNTYAYYIYLLQTNKIYSRAIEVAKKYEPQNKKRLINLYLGAKDYKKAIDLLKNSSDGKDKLTLAKLYFKTRAFKHSILSLNDKNFKAKAKLHAEALILKAICFYQLKDLKNYEKVLKKALENPHSRKQANKMLRYIE